MTALVSLETEDKLSSLSSTTLRKLNATVSPEESFLRSTVLSGCGTPFYMIRSLSINFLTELSFLLFDVLEILRDRA